MITVYDSYWMIKISKEKNISKKIPIFVEPKPTNFTQMKHCIFLLLGIIGSISGLHAQTGQLTPTVDRAVYFDVSPPLRNMYLEMPPFDNSWKTGAVPNRFNDFEEGQQETPLFTDPVLQDQFGSLQPDTTISNFDGMGAGGAVPPDTYGEAGLAYYFQVVNTAFAIFNKTGEMIFGPYASNTIWLGMPNNANSGDAVVLYDEAADRWLFSQFSLPNYPNGPFFQMIAISQTSDPTGSWYRWQYEFPLMPDYPKFGVWQDGYYMSSNNFGNQGFDNNGDYGYDRTAMLAGDPDAVRISFNIHAGGSGFNTIYPADCDGPLPPAGTPNYFGFIKRGSPQYFGFYEFHADFANPTNSTFGNLLQINVSPFTSQLNGIPQLESTRLLEAISDRLMYRVQYRRFDGYDAIVANHTVNVGNYVAGVRWYEFRKTTGDWSLYQEGTYAPADGHSRWMGSIALDTAGSIALGYSISSSTMYPGIRYTGRLKNDPAGEMTMTEKSVIEGGGSQTGSWSGRSRWGDYSAMSVDPANPTTFWYTTEYYQTTSTSDWSTRVGSFTFENVFSTFASATPATFCLGEDTVQLNAVAYGGSGSYTWSWTSIPEGFTSDLQNPLVIPTDTTLYIVATSDGNQTRQDTVLVQVAYLPEIFAGNDTVICIWQPSVDLHGSAEYYRNFVWGSYGDGIFGDKYSLETSYFPGDDDRQNGGVTLALVAFAESPCTGMFMDSLYLTIDPCTGIEERAADAVRMSIRPNPAKERAVLVISTKHAMDGQLTVAGMDGRLTLQEPLKLETGRNEATLELTGFSKGIYIVQLKTDQGVVTERMVVN
ncbi:MAG: T9SS C-terminal target domain-containing protein [Bacteroidetes bacterium]|nr:MAG: T9SS C-terminal target domain-containing protein [Bacteroidota bacterium]